ncbi:Glyoxylate/hydroxypyruvate reductase A [Nocardioides aquaticus]|uniref:Glyoxylate/hydroxypyruvate reductase A n=1 Tax=Nocardioides aquaticus TaxID=160826 RepID=A0ABX8EGK4_9ACTN|nr:2-hydroxyacid dehydrogenase [Nocardioides aquaticus]QVT79641.1 Glyoxylate/hydroxypyruvate reductase A [Nocardioides aquaticus]
MSEPLVWLPFDPSELGEVPAGLRYEVVPTLDEVPASVGEVELVVTPYDLGDQLGEAVKGMERLRVVQTLTAGVDAVRASVPAGVTLCNGRGIHDTSTAELAFLLVLAGLRDLPRFVRAQDRREWSPAWRGALAGKRVSVVGAGSIASALQRRLEAFEAEVTMVGRTARDGVHATDELPSLLPEQDVVVLLVPLTDATRGLVDADFLAALPDGALLVNVARGAVVDTDALLAELGTGRLRAALDVFETEPLPDDSPLWDARGLILTPHVGGLSDAMWPRAYRLVREQLERFAAGEPLENVMDGDY